MGKLPVLEDAAVFGSGPGCALPESGAILRYLVRRFVPAPPSRSSSSLSSSCYYLYPHADAAAAALVDAAVCWHFSALRPGCSGVVWALVLAETVPRGGAPRRAGAEGPAAAAASLASLELALDALEGTTAATSGDGDRSSSSPPSSSSTWLLSVDGGFLAGRSRPSIADLLVATELDQLRLLDALSSSPIATAATATAAVDASDSGDSPSLPRAPPPPPPSMASLLAPRPRVRAYLARVRDAVGAEEWDGASAVLGRVVANLRGGRGEGQRQREAERPRL